MHRIMWVNEIQTFKLSSQILHLRICNIMQVNKIQARPPGRKLPDYYPANAMSSFAHKNNENCVCTPHLKEEQHLSITYNVKLLVKIIRAKSYRLFLRNLKSRPCNGTLIIMVATTDVWKIMEVLHIHQFLQIFQHLNFWMVWIFQHFRVVSVWQYKIVSVDWHHIANLKQCLQKYTNKKV